MDYIDTKYVAAELKRRLQNAFPAVKFNVRKGTGTASAWISVYWTDGPNTAEVEELTRPMQGAQFNGQEDRYESTDNTVTLTVKGRKVTGKPLVDGINTHRETSDDALKAAAALCPKPTMARIPPRPGGQVPLKSTATPSGTTGGARRQGRSPSMSSCPSAGPPPRDRPPPRPRPSGEHLRGGRRVHGGTHGHGRGRDDGHRYASR
ncbi:LPD29 domain-containing protein [Streptomyces sp. NPDC001984]